MQEKQFRYDTKYDICMMHEYIIYAEGAHINNVKNCLNTIVKPILKTVINS